MILDESVTPAVLGYRFEVRMMAKLQSGLNINAYSYSTRKVKSFITPAITSRMELREEGTSLNDTGGAVLYIPPKSSFKFPHWDAVLHVPPSEDNPKHQIKFFQFTISTPIEHEQNEGILKSFRVANKDESGKSLSQKIVEDITGIPITFTVSKLNGTDKSDTITYSYTDQLDAEFVMFSFSPKEKFMSGYGSSKIPSNLLIIFKEELQVQLKNL